MKKLIGFALLLSIIVAGPVGAQQYSICHSGGNSYIEFPISPYVNGIAYQEFTAELWCKLEGGNDEAVFSLGNYERGVPTYFGLWLHFYDGGWMVFMNEQCGCFSSWSCYPITWGQWAHIAATFNNGNWAMFVDGQLAAEGNCPNDSLYLTPYYHWMTNTHWWVRGSDCWSHRMAGCISEIRLSNTIRYTGNFSPEIRHSPDSYTLALWHLDEGSGTVAHDASGHGIHGTIYNSAWIGDVPLPVELLSFTAIPAEIGIRLSFSVASETDNDHFEILRGERAEGEFTRIMTLPSQGNSATEQRYEYTDTDVNPGQTYWYYLADVDMSGHRTEHRGMITSATALDPVVAPSEYSLSVYPNPFNPSTTISFSLPEAGIARVAVYDVAGRWIKTLADDERGAGTHRIAFDARDLPSGVYFVRMESGEFQATRKVVLMR